MAEMLVRVLLTAVLLAFVPGAQALDLLRATASSGDPPPPPRVHCWCAGYPNLTFCSWPEPPDSSPTHYIVTYSERHKQQSSTKKCDVLPPGSALHAPALVPEQHWRCHLPDLKLLTDYIINVTAVRSGGSSVYLASFMLEDIVKPDPPVEVQVVPHGSRGLLVEWSPPATWSSLHIFPLKYQIQYQWENRGTFKSVNLGPFESTSVELKGLVPGRVYRIQVCAKELLDLGQCSSWSSPADAVVPKKKA